MRISQIVADSSGFDRAPDAQGRRWSSFTNRVEESVELENDTDAPQDLSSWELRDANDPQFVFAFPAGTVVPSGAALQVRSGEGTNTPTDLFWGPIAPVWNNLGDTVFLYDAGGNLIAQRSFPDFTPKETPSYLLPQFAAETYPAERAIALLWEIPLSIATTTFPDPDVMPLRILRRERRFPGLNRKGVIPVEPLEDFREDGTLVYETPTFAFDREEQREEQVGDRTILTRYQYRYQGEPRDRVLVRRIQEESVWPATGGGPRPLRLTVRIIDRQDLTPGMVYYYTAFVGPGYSGPGYVFSSQTQASALATDGYGHSLFDALPLVHKQFDIATPEPATVGRTDANKGQLQRFLEVFEAHADMLHGFTDGLRDVHNPRRVDSRLLPPLAQMLGWQFKSQGNEDRQRTELRFAPEIYNTVGTVNNIAAIINLLTGWKTEVKEFARNVLTSVDTTRFEQLEGRVEYLDQPSVMDNRVYLDGSFRVTKDYAKYLKGEGSLPTNYFQGRRLPPGSLDVPPRLDDIDRNDPEAMKSYRAKSAVMAKLRNKTFDDQTVYSYHPPPANENRDDLPDRKALYNQQTVGLFITVDTGSEDSRFEQTESFTPEQTIQQIYRVIREFLPIQVRPVFYIRVLYKESYETFKEVRENTTDVGTLIEQEVYGEITDDVSDRIPGWRWLISNRSRHRSVLIPPPGGPPDTSSRSWHIGLDQGIEEEE